jgi:flagellar basal-body rod modification protein FlgD
MSVTSATSSTPADISSLATQTAGRTPTKSLSSADFIHLLTVQLQNQDPSAPMDSNQQMQQIVQISSMQNMQDMTANLSSLSAGQSWSLANSYLGRQVTLTDPQSKQSVTGQVSAVDTSGTSPQIMVNGAYYPISTVTNIQLPPPPAPTAG